MTQDEGRSTRSKASGAGGSGRRTVAVSPHLFREVYDSPRSLPGKEAWITRDADVRELEQVLKLPADSIGAPLWVSGDRRTCPTCDREINWLDIVTSALGTVHDRALISSVILGEQRFVNVELDAIAGVRCFGCQTAIEGLRSFKCHNWAYAHGDIARLVTNAAK